MEDNSGEGFPTLKADYFEKVYNMVLQFKEYLDSVNDCLGKWQLDPVPAISGPRS
jgi:hypothetical protein